MFGNRWIQLKWPDAVLTEAERTDAISMPYLELLALVIALRTWANLLSGKRVLIESDCQPVVEAVNRAWAGNEGMADLICEIADVSIRYSCQIRAKHLPGITNTIPDLLSRNQAAQSRLAQPSLNLHSDLPRLSSTTH